MKACVLSSEIYSYVWQLLAPARLMYPVCRKVTGSLKIVHDKYAKNHEEYVSYTDQFKAAISMNEHIEPHIRKVQIKAIAILVLMVIVVHCSHIELLQLIQLGTRSVLA